MWSLIQSGSFECGRREPIPIEPVAPVWHKLSFVKLGALDVVVSSRGSFGCGWRELWLRFVGALAVLCGSFGCALQPGSAYGVRVSGIPNMVLNVLLIRYEFEQLQNRYALTRESLFR
jgi:hypothetical protein